ncbi:MAG: hypothetical protein ABIJ65_07535 [Chloroflexota bacterium]
MRSLKYSLIICISIFLLILSGCIIKDSPAPGCRKSIGFPMMGGCSGKTAILDLEIEYAPECVIIEVNNCNGGVLNIRNTCEKDIHLQDIVIPTNDSVSLDVKMVDGSIELIQSHGNFSDFIPEEDTRIELMGEAGIDLIKFAFTKTKRLCE